jgi:hypothetical protein
MANHDQGPPGVEEALAAALFNDDLSDDGPGGIEADPHDGPGENHDHPHGPAPPKRARLLCEEEWEDNFFEGLIDAGLELDIQNDTDPKVESFATATQQLHEKLMNTMESWGTMPSLPKRKALLVIALYMDTNIHWDSKSDLLLARLVGTLQIGALRAHSDAVRHYSNGAWRKILVLPGHVVQEIEEALNLARYLFYHLKENIVTRSWDAVFEYLADFDQWDNYVPVEDYELLNRHWAAVAGQTLRTLPWRLASARSNAGLGSFATWYQEDLPRDALRLNFEDCTLDLQQGVDDLARAKQISKSPDNNCYQHLAITLTWKPPDDDRKRLHEFLATSFAGNPKGRFIVMCVESLALLNKQHVQKMIFPRGTGGNSKSMLAAP